MSKRVKVKLNSAGVRELLKSSAMAGVCRTQADAVKNRCGSGYTVSAYTGRTRVNCSVVAETPEARRNNSENNTILKALK